jgi:hypothetical protein
MGPLDRWNGFFHFAYDHHLIFFTLLKKLIFFHGSQHADSEEEQAVKQTSGESHEERQCDSRDRGRGRATNSAKGYEMGA